MVPKHRLGWSTGIQSFREQRIFMRVSDLLLWLPSLMQEALDPLSM